MKQQTKVKICGLTDQRTVEYCVEQGADFIGFVFAESKRAVTPEAVRKLTCAVPKAVAKVGVFVDPSPEEVIKTIEIAQLDRIQLHCSRLSPSHFPVPVTYAVSSDDFLKLDPFSTNEIDDLLIDAPPERFVGGNGRTFEWKSINPKTIDIPHVWIAGGLTEENVAAAIHYFQPYAVDVSSGVETKGKKDLQKIKKFIQQVKECYYV